MTLFDLFRTKLASLFIYLPSPKWNKERVHIFDCLKNLSSFLIPVCNLSCVHLSETVQSNKKDVHISKHAALCYMILFRQRNILAIPNLGMLTPSDTCMFKNSHVHRHFIKMGTPLNKTHLSLLRFWEPFLGNPVVTW